jgi:hypothetical protein
MRKGLLLVAAILIVGGIVAFRVLRLGDLAYVGAGYTAQQTCACLFVSHRSAESCSGDLEPMARWFVSVTPGTDTVTARSFLIARATARYQKDFGCALQD